MNRRAVVLDSFEALLTRERRALLAANSGEVADVAQAKLRLEPELRALKPLSRDEHARLSVLADEARTNGRLLSHLVGCVRQMVALVDDEDPTYRPAVAAHARNAYARAGARR